MPVLILLELFDSMLIRRYLTASSLHDISLFEHLILLLLSFLCEVGLYGRHLLQKK